MLFGSSACVSEPILLRDSGVMGALDSNLSRRSRWVSSPKLLSESGVAGGEGGWDGMDVCTSIGPLP